MATAAMVVAQLKLIYGQRFSIHVGPPPDEKKISYFARYIDGAPSAAEVCNYVKDDVELRVRTESINVINENTGIKYWLSNPKQ